MDLFEIIDSETLMRKGFTQDVMICNDPPKRWSIIKKNGQSRVIYHPSAKNKLLQYWLITRVLDKLPIHRSAYAFIKNKNIKDNALIHANSKNNYFIKMDLKNFFPSIKFIDFERCFNKYRNLIGVPGAYDDELLNLIEVICFISSDLSLPVGYPSSPFIANFVARELDELICKKLQPYNEMNVVYTRYADDIIISVNEKGQSNKLINTIKSAVRTVPTKISVNETKSKICSSSGGSIVVTGLKICHDNHLTIHKKMKDDIRLRLNLFSKGILNPDENNRLSGIIAYAKSIDEHFYTKISRKYFNELKELENHHLK